MSAGTLYGMVTVRSSSDYTVKAVETFLKHTVLEPDDEFVLIDNDGDWVENYGNVYSANVVVNATPKNTSQNINQILDRAASKKQDAVFLSNDVIFTPKWNKKLLKDNDIVSIPSCNQTHNYGFPSSLSLKDFGNHYPSLNALAYRHATFYPVPYERLMMPPYVGKYPYRVYSTVGMFDENYNVGGEDVDYRIRLLQHGFSIKYCSSYLLHFNGRSSWNGAETTEETQARDSKYSAVFRARWGEDLYNLCITGGNPRTIIEKYDLTPLLQQEKFNEMILKVANA